MCHKKKLKKYCEHLSKERKLEDLSLIEIENISLLIDEGVI